MHDQTTTSIGHRPVQRFRSLLGLGVVVLAGLALLTSACSSDDSSDSTQAYCDSVDSLETNITALGDMDVAADGTDAITEQFDAIKSSAEDLQVSGPEAASTEIDDLETSVSDLGSAIDALGSDPSVDAVGTVATDIGNTITAAQAVVDKLADSCS